MSERTPDQIREAYKKTHRQNRLLNERDNALEANNPNYRAYIEKKMKGELGTGNTIDPTVH